MNFVDDVMLTKSDVRTIVLLPCESEFETVATPRVTRFTHELGFLKPTLAFHGNWTLLPFSPRLGP